MKTPAALEIEPGSGEEKGRRCLGTHAIAASPTPEGSETHPKCSVSPPPPLSLHTKPSWPKPHSLPHEVRDRSLSKQAYPWADTPLYWSLPLPPPPPTPRSAPSDWLQVLSSRQGGLAWRLGLFGLFFFFKLVSLFGSVLSLFLNDSKPGQVSPGLISLPLQV